MRLIDADALIEEWYRINDIDENDRGARFVGYTEIVRMINNIPTIDAVEVVKCKDCKHMKYAIDKAKNGMCGVHSALIIMNGNDYCSYGERKSDDDVI